MNELIAELRAEGFNNFQVRAVIGLFNRFTKVSDACRVKVPGTDYYLTFAIEEIGPVQAQAYLDTSKVNRTIKTPNVFNIAQAVRLMQWRCNGESIIFDWNGNLRDGHHRLLAVIDSGIPITCVVVRGIDPLAVATIDLGIKRGGGDVMRCDEGLMVELDRTSGLNQMAGALTWMWKFEEDMMCAKRTVGLTASRCPEFMRKYPGIAESFKKVGGVHNILGHSPATFLHYQFSINSSAEVADKFFQLLKSGVSQAANDPIFRLRERLTKDKVRGVNGPTYEKIALAIKAFNLWRAGKKVNLLVWRELQEPFPVLVNERIQLEPNGGRSHE